MNWTKDKSILLSQACVGVFAALLLALDCGAYQIAGWFVSHQSRTFRFGLLLMTSTYAGSVPAWICLFRLWRLLGGIKRGEVFVPANVRHMRVISWCCAAAALICAASVLYYLPFGFVTIAAGFMALIVRIVKNAFQQAIDMKDELDLTI